MNVVLRRWSWRWWRLLLVKSYQLQVGDHVMRLKYHRGVIYVVGEARNAQHK